MFMNRFGIVNFGWIHMRPIVSLQPGTSAGDNSREPEADAAQS